MEQTTVALKRSCYILDREIQKVKIKSQKMHQLQMSITPVIPILSRSFILHVHSIHMRYQAHAYYGYCTYAR